MKNIGCVIYTVTDDEIEADWVLSNNNKVSRGSGHGKILTAAKENDKFEGTYEIIYHDETGMASPTLKLIIQREAMYYKLSWMHNEVITDLGIGIESNNQLSAGWFKVKD